MSFERSLFEKQNWLVGHQWTFPIHRKKNNTLGLGEYEFILYALERNLSDLGRNLKFKLLFLSFIIASVW
jgi:hypothetical protein